MIGKLKISKNYFFIIFVFLTTSYSCSSDTNEPETPTTEETVIPPTEDETEESSDGTSLNSISY